VFVAILVLAAQAASAHIPQVRGRLIDLVSQSDLIIVGSVENVKPVDAGRNETTARVVGELVGDTDDAAVTFRGRARFAPGQRSVFFLRRAGTSLEVLQPLGAVFASRPQDDAAYRATIVAIQRALPTPADERPAALRAAIIPALSAAAPPLRYQAALELAGLAHHGLTPSERHALERLAADPATDAAIRPLLASLLDATGESFAESAPTRP
jgi:hypothetical protein